MDELSWRAGIGIATQAYELALDKFAARSRKSVAKIRQCAHYFLQDRMLAIHFLEHALEFQQHPNESTVKDFNLAIVQAWANYRSAAFREQLVDVIRAVSLGTPFQVCGYCAGLFTSLPFAEKYCSKRCWKGTYNRRDNRRRGIANGRRKHD
jgi:hypothetical protein